MYADLHSLNRIVLMPKWVGMSALEKRKFKSHAEFLRQNTVPGLRSYDAFVNSMYQSRLRQLHLAAEEAFLARVQSAILLKWLNNGNVVRIKIAGGKWNWKFGKDMRMEINF